MQLCNRVIDKSTLIAILGSKPATGIRGATRSMRGEALFRSKRLISRFFHFHSRGGKLDSIVLFVSLLVSILPANQPSSPIRRRCISLEGDSSGSPSRQRNVAGEWSVNWLNCRVRDRGTNRSNYGTVWTETTDLAGYSKLIHLEFVAFPRKNLFLHLEDEFFPKPIRI